MKLQKIKKFLVGSLLILGLVFPLPVAALEGFRAQVEYLDNSKFPQIDAYLSVSDANGLPLENLKQDAFVLTEDGLPVAIQSFQAVQNKSQPLSIVLIMDTSGSMRGKSSPTPLQKAIEAATAFVGQLAPQDRVAVIKFSDQPNEVLSLTEDKLRVKQAIESLQPEGQYTALYDAVIKGLNILESQSGRRIIVLITDGKDTGRGVFKSEDAMRELSAQSMPIYPMGFGNSINATELRKMAELTGGSAKILPSELELSRSFDEVLSSLRGQYLIRYISSFPADNKQHELITTVNYGGGQEKASYLFIAKSSVIPVALPDLQPNQVIGGIVKFSIATDWPSAIIKNVDVSVDGTPISITKSPAKDFVYEWNSFGSGITSGPHNFLFKVTDVGGNTGQASLPLNVQPPIMVEITSPQNGSLLSSANQITAKIVTLPGITLSKVTFLVDNKELVSVPGTAAQTEYTVAWNTSEARQYPVKVVAYDTEGRFTTESDTIFVNVQPGGFGVVIVVIVLALAALIIPLALRSRKQKGMAIANIGIASSGKPVLYEMEGLNPNQTWSLGVSEVKLGRKREENDIPLKGLKASRRHAVIRFEQGQYFIYSLSAENPVIINNQPIAQKHALMRGDVLLLGETVLRFDA